MTTATPEPIHNPDFEFSLLGGVLAGVAIPEGLKAEHFYQVKHATIYRAILDAAAAGEPVCELTITQRMREADKLEGIGGGIYLSSLTDDPDVVNTGFYAAKIIEAARGREVVKLGARLQHGEALEAVLPKLVALADTNRGTIETRRILIEPFGDVVQLDLPKRSYIAEPWLPERGLAMCYAPKGTGKTELALTVSVGVAAGSGVLGWKIPKARRVVFFDGELDLDDLRRRIAAICQGLNLDDDATSRVAQNLFIVSRDRMLRLGMRVGYLTDPAEQELLKAALPTAVDLVVFDNLSCLFGGEENDACSWDNTLMFLLRLKHETGLTAWFLHHSGKSGDQRGTSRREDNLDTSMRLEPVIEKGELTSDGIKFRIVWAKHRGFRLKDAPSVLCTAERDGLATRWKVSRTDDMRLDALVKEYGFCLREEGETPTVRALQSRLEMLADDEGEPNLRCSRSTVQRLLQRARKIGLLEGQYE